MITERTAAFISHWLFQLNSTLGLCLCSCVLVKAMLWMCGQEQWSNWILKQIKLSKCVWKRGSC